jgi:hypothetical protein
MVRFFVTSAWRSGFPPIFAIFRSFDLVSFLFFFFPTKVTRYLMTYDSVLLERARELSGGIPEKFLSRVLP